MERLSEADADSNIDFFHMFRAYRYITEWFLKFEHRATHEATRLYGYLFDHVKVLWYQAPEDVNSTDLFTRLNVGRIPLTDAELTKALLLSRTQLGEGQTDRSLEIAAQWDSIERDLRVPEVWAFVTGEANEEATHISLLLDTMSGGVRGRERPLFQTFESLRGRVEEDPSGFWRDVVELHSLVLGWYEDRTLFHKIGYLIAVGKTFGDLVKISSDTGRSAFEARLDEGISTYLNLTSDDVADLTYTSRKTADVLLLMNVETIRKTQDSAERYSFRAHAAGSWSLEHIHAQNAVPLSTVEQWRTWLKFHRDALLELPDISDDRRSEFLAEIEELLSSNVTGPSFRALASELAAEFASPGESDSDEVDSIANLALLDSRDNSALNNSVFDVKRRDIIRRDKKGSYIPVCTRNVFLKYYTETGGQQLYFWSAADRQGYLEAIQEAVGPYLQPEVVDE